MGLFFLVTIDIQFNSYESLIGSVEFKLILCLITFLELIYIAFETYFIVLDILKWNNLCNENKEAQQNKS